MASFSVFLLAAAAGMALASAAEPCPPTGPCKGWTIPMSKFTDEKKDSGCTTTMAGCTGELVDQSTHGINGTIVVKDDCTFAVHGWQFDGEGPAVEWWAAMIDEDGAPDKFPYPANAKKIAKLGKEGAYPVGDKLGGESDIVVRLGRDDWGVQKMLSEEFNHISVWCERFQVDFGNAQLTCE